MLQVTENHAVQVLPDCADRAKEGETDTAIAPGGQAREHAFLLKTLGVKQIIVAINKMDDSNYSEDAFKAAREKR